MAPLKIGDMFFCKCPKGVCELPDGLPENALEAVYMDRTYVRYYNKTFAVRNICLYKESDSQ